MSFYGAFAATAERLAAQLCPVLELTLNEPTWDGSAAVHLASDAVSARGRSYEPRVLDGGWQSVTRQIDVRAAGLEALTTSVTIADTDNKLRSALLDATVSQRNSRAAIYRVIPGSASDYASIFVGLLDGWEFQAGQVTLNLKTDERVLRSYHPAWPYLKSEWFWMAADKVGTYAPLCYGKHDSTGLGLDHGLVPSVPLWFNGGTAWYGVCLAPANLIKNVYVDGVLQSEADYAKVYGSYAGGKVVTMIEWVTTPPSDDAKITADLYGYAATTGEGNYDGSGTITNPVSQIRSFLVEFAVNQTKGYIPAAWDSTADIIDSTSWNTAATWALTHGLEGARYLQEPATALEIFREWLESFPMMRAFWNSEGKIEMRVLSADWPGYWPGGSIPILRREDELGQSFLYSLDSSDVTGRISAQYLYDSVEGKFLRSLDVQDLDSDVISTTAYQFYWAPARQT